ncbi:uncharacterized protein LOC124530683 [Vanessa cardui]|uniref:uncharacterized protein LOC124530683 n=1 Tax=Vanessa cardui TaxID=171605 RepID=UPI001F129A75|nr:uncharacterized protein LOC124530683 [Vanessa cardui]
MCRTLHALLQTVICGVQMLVRVFMTVILMIENLIRMILQTMYNFISFLLQMLSLIPICIVFLLTARLKCFMCGGGGPCPVNRGGACDCIMSALAIIILFFIFRATGVLDKIFYSLGYTKAKIPVYEFVPTPGDITECSRNDTDYTDDISTTFTTDFDQSVDRFFSMDTSSTYTTDETSIKLEENSEAFVKPVETSEIDVRPVETSEIDVRPEETSVTGTSFRNKRLLQDIVRNTKIWSNFLSY